MDGAGIGHLQGTILGLKNREDSGFLESHPSPQSFSRKKPIWMPSFSPVYSQCIPILRFIRQKRQRDAPTFPKESEGAFYLGAHSQGLDCSLEEAREAWFSQIQESREKRAGTRCVCGLLSSRKTVAPSPSPGLSTRNSGALLDRALAWMSSSHGFLSTSPHPQKKEKKKSQKNPSPIWRIKCLGGNPSSAESGGKAPSTSPGKNFQVLSAPEL